MVVTTAPGRLLMNLGMLHGHLADPPTRARVVAALQLGDLRAEYLQRLRDALTDVLVQAGVEPGEPSAASEGNAP